MRRDKRKEQSSASRVGLDVLALPHGHKLGRTELSHVTTEADETTDVFPLEIFIVADIVARRRVDGGSV